jgi:sugar lactone lactonase YvrE
MRRAIGVALILVVLMIIAVGEDALAPSDSVDLRAVMQGAKPKNGARPLVVAVDRVLEGKKADEIGVPAGAAFDDKGVLWVADSLGAGLHIVAYTTDSARAVGNWDIPVGDGRIVDISAGVGLEPAVLLEDGVIYHYNGSTWVRFAPKYDGEVWARAFGVTASGYVVLAYDHLFSVTTEGNVKDLAQDAANWSLTVNPTEVYMGPSGVLTDEDGSIWLADTQAGRLLKLGPEGQLAATWRLPEVEGAQASADDLVRVGSEIWVLSLSANQVVCFGENGEITGNLPLPDGPRAGSGGITAAKGYMPVLTLSNPAGVYKWDGRERAFKPMLPHSAFIFPLSVAATNEGVYVLNSAWDLPEENQLLLLDGDTGLVLGKQPVDPDRLEDTAPVQVQGLGNSGVYVLDYMKLTPAVLGENDTAPTLLPVSFYGEGDAPAAVTQSQAAGVPLSPQGFAMDARQSTLLVADTFGHAIIRFNKNGAIIEKISLPEQIWPTRVAASGDTIIVLDGYQGDLWQLNGGQPELLQAGVLSLIADTGMFTNTGGLTLGEDGRIYIADTLGNRVLVIEKDGKMVGQITGVGEGQLLLPTDVTYRNGLLYTADYGNQRIVVFKIQGEAN